MVHVELFEKLFEVDLRSPTLRQVVVPRRLGGSRTDERRDPLQPGCETARGAWPKQSRPSGTRAAASRALQDSGVDALLDRARGRRVSCEIRGGFRPPGDLELREDR